MYQAVAEGGRDVPCLGLKFDVLFFSNLCVSLSRPVTHKYQWFVRLWFSHSMRQLCQWSNVATKLCRVYARALSARTQVGAPA